MTDTSNLARVMRYVEQQRNAALDAAAVNGAHVEALSEQLDLAGKEIARLRAELEAERNRVQMIEDAMGVLESTVRALRG